MLKPFFSLICLSLGAFAACSPEPVVPKQAAFGEPGEVLAKRLCSDCHAIGATGLSRHLEAPPFRDFGETYPVEYLAESFAEGIIVGHPDMPVFELSPDEISALISYLEKVRVSASPAD
ncbi:MAG: cytochrome c [Alphaproteobacteria bacterium]|nr:cytochrome c [Alphaproteobacteria bacterium]